MRSRGKKRIVLDSSMFSHACQPLVGSLSGVRGTGEGL